MYKASGESPRAPGPSCYVFHKTKYFSAAIQNSDDSDVTTPEIPPNPTSLTAIEETTTSGELIGISFNQFILHVRHFLIRKNSEYDQEIPQSQAAQKPRAS